MIVASYPKSGLHLARKLLRSAGQETTHTHNGPDSLDLRAQQPDLHVVRDVRDVVVSAVCYFVLRRPELHPPSIRPHVLAMSEALAGHWEHAPGSASWSHYVLAMSARARLTVTYRDLVERPQEALAPLGVTLGAQIGAEGATWAQDTFRRGVPGGWRDTLTPSQAEAIVDQHRAGMLVVGAQNEGVCL